MNALCQMTGLSRAGFYRWRVPRQATPVEMELRDQMQKVALESPAYGYRRITSELQQRGFEVNHKRVLRMMREDNLLCVRRRAFVVTTDSRHNLPVYPNLARETIRSPGSSSWSTSARPNPSMWILQAFRSPCPPKRHSRTSNQASRCLEECLRKLDDDQRELIIEYYRGDRRVKIDHRRSLAGRLGLTMNAVTIRACRIRDRLETCVRGCSATQGDDRISGLRLI